MKSMYTIFGDEEDGFGEEADENDDSVFTEDECWTTQF